MDKMHQIDFVAELGRACDFGAYKDTYKKSELDKAVNIKSSK